MKSCEHCGKQFKVNKLQKEHRFCSPSCQARHYKETHLLPIHTCQYCDKEFRPKAWDRTTYCSRDCGFASKVKCYKFSKVEYVKCDICNKWYGKRIKSPYNLCSDTCKKKHKLRLWNKKKETYLLRMRENYIPKEKIARICVSCGGKFKGHQSEVVCSEICRKRNNKNHKDHAHRARHYNVKREPVDRIKVFKRDKWTCQLCGVNLNQSDMGTIKDVAPELDHIIPISRGGGHTYENTQCSCRKCNQLKGANVIGQYAYMWND